MRTHAALLMPVCCFPSCVAALSNLALQFTQSSKTAVVQRCVCHLLSCISFFLSSVAVLMHHASFSSVDYISVPFSILFLSSVRNTVAV